MDTASSNTRQTRTATAYNTRQVFEYVHEEIKLMINLRKSKWTRSSKSRTNLAAIFAGLGAEGPASRFFAALVDAPAFAVELLVAELLLLALVADVVVTVIADT